VECINLKLYKFIKVSKFLQLEDGFKSQNKNPKKRTTASHVIITKLAKSDHSAESLPRPGSSSTTGSSSQIRGRGRGRGVNNKNSDLPAPGAIENGQNLTNNQVLFSVFWITLLLSSCCFSLLIVNFVLFYNLVVFEWNKAVFTRIFNFELQKYHFHLLKMLMFYLTIHFVE